MDLKRMRELAGLQEKDFRTKGVDSMSKEELVSLKETLEKRIANAFILAETKFADQVKLKAVNAQLQAIEDQITEHLTQVDGKWAIVSKKTGKPLRYYKGEGKPSQEWVDKQEKSIEYFKHMNEDSTEQPQDDEDTEVVVEVMTLITQPEQKVPEIDYAQDSQDEVPLVAPLQSNVEQDEKTPVKLPPGLMSDIDKRIAELTKSMEEFDKEEFKIHYHNKQKAIDCLEFIKEKLNTGNLVGFKQAVIFYGTIAHFISEMFPTKLVLFLHTGMEQKKEEPTNSAMDGDPNKLKEKDIPLQAGTPPTDTPIYPQIPKSKNTPD